MALNAFRCAKSWLHSVRNYCLLARNFTVVSGYKAWLSRPCVQYFSGNRQKYAPLFMRFCTTESLTSNTPEARNQQAYIAKANAPHVPPVEQVVADRKAFDHQLKEYLDRKAYIEVLRATPPEHIGWGFSSLRLRLHAACELDDHIDARQTYARLIMRFKNKYFDVTEYQRPVLKEEDYYAVIRMYARHRVYRGILHIFRDMQDVSGYTLDSWTKKFYTFLRKAEAAELANTDYRMDNWTLMCVYRLAETIGLKVQPPSGEDIANRAWNIKFMPGMEMR